MSNSQPFDITDDAQLRNAVRMETGYDEETISIERLKALVESAKRVLALKADVTSFYDERGLAVALQGVTCAKAKGEVENSPVRAENIGPTDTRFRTTDGSSLQVAHYEQMVELGLSSSQQADDGADDIYLTNTYLTDSRGV